MFALIATAVLLANQGSVSAVWSMAARAVGYHPDSDVRYSGHPGRGWLEEGVRCPADTRVTSGNGERWCQDDHGERHGPSTRFSPEGVRLEDGTWYRGSPHGLWLYWRDDALVEAGVLHYGARMGNWLRCAEGEAIERSSWLFGERFGGTLERLADGQVVMRIYAKDEVVSEAPGPRSFGHAAEVCGVTIRSAPAPTARGH